MVSKMSSYLRETSQELKRVSWPSIADLKESTVVVMITVAVITVMLYAVDKILDLGMHQLTKLG